MAGTQLTQINGAVIGTSAVESFAAQTFDGPVPLQTYCEIYTGEVRLSFDANIRVITLRNKTFGSGDVAGVEFYNSASPFNKQIGVPSLSDRKDQLATITHMPAPGVLGAGNLALVWCSRRKRR